MPSQTVPTQVLLSLHCTHSNVVGLQAGVGVPSQSFVSVALQVTHLPSGLQAGKVVDGHEFSIPESLLPAQATHVPTVPAAVEQTGFVGSLQSPEVRHWMHVFDGPQKPPGQLVSSMHPTQKPLLQNWPGHWVLSVHCAVQM